MNIYSVSVYGGVPKEIAKETEGWFSLSPDDRQVSFVRCPHEDENFCSLYVADPNGATERKILTRPRPIRIGENQFSPDGQSIAVAIGQSDNSANDFSLREINAETGAEQEITKQKFFNILHICWLPDQSGFLMTGTEAYQQPAKIYQVSRQTGQISALTKDTTLYNHVSLDKLADKMVVTQFTPDFRLWTAPASDMKAAQIVSYAKDGFVYTPSGKLLYSSGVDSNQNIWIMNGDGTEQRQLTNSQGANWGPIVSTDEQYIFFSSSRSGSKQVWRMNMDGSNQTQISNDEGGDPVFVTADGNAVYYKTSLNLNLKKITITKDGNFVSDSISNERIYSAAFNSTGDTVAYLSRKGNDTQEVALMSAADGKVLKSVPLPDEKYHLIKINWSKDNKYLYYLLRNGLRSTIWRVSLETGRADLINELHDHEVTDFSFSPDGKTFAFICGRWKHDAFLIQGLK